MASFANSLVRGTHIHTLYGMERAYNATRKGSQLSAINYCKKGEQSHNGIHSDCFFILII